MILGNCYKSILCTLRKVFPGICFKNLAVSPTSKRPVAMRTETNLAKIHQRFALKLKNVVSPRRRIKTSKSIDNNQCLTPL